VHDLPAHRETGGQILQPFNVSEARSGQSRMPVLQLRATSGNEEKTNPCRAVKPEIRRKPHHRRMSVE
jgi:hypothetical protein